MLNSVTQLTVTVILVDLECGVVDMDGKLVILALS